VFFALTNTGGAKIMPNLPMLLHRTQCALCGSVEKNAYSLVNGITLCAQVGGGEGGKGHGQNRPPPSVRGPLVFCCCCAKDFF